MATRSTIALEFADGTVQSVYCHWDGYLENNGKLLMQHYMDPFKVRELIDLGSLSSLAPEIGVKHQFDNPHPYKSVEWQAWHDAHKNQCTFYGRDRGEDDVTSIKFANFLDYVQNLNGEEYDYILRKVGNDSLWFVRHDDTEGQWIPLQKAITAQESEE